MFWPVWRMQSTLGIWTRLDSDWRQSRALALTAAQEVYIPALSLSELKWQHRRYTGQYCSALTARYARQCQGEGPSLTYRHATRGWQWSKNPSGIAGPWKEAALPAPLRQAGRDLLEQLSCQDHHGLRNVPLAGIRDWGKCQPESLGRSIARASRMAMLSFWGIERGAGPLRFLVSSMKPTRSLVITMVLSSTMRESFLLLLLICAFLPCFPP